MSPSRRIAELAARQHGAVAAHQLRSLGVSKSAVHRMVLAGKLHVRHHGVFAVGHPALSREGTWMAAVLAGGEDAALSHISAAQHWGITRRTTRRIEISTPRYRRAIAGVTTHFLRPLQSDGSVTSREGIPVTTVVRTIVDLAETMDVEELEFVMHEAAHWKLFDPRDIDAIIAANPRFRGRGRLRAALAGHTAGHTGARSRLELRVRRYLESVGIPPSTAGLHVSTPMGVVEVDRGWPDRRIYLEVDGFGHSRRATKRKDRERDQALALAGWRTFRVDGDAFDKDPAAATAAIRAAFS